MKASYTKQLILRYAMCQKLGSFPTHPVFPVKDFKADRGPLTFTFCQLLRLWGLHLGLALQSKVMLFP